jgi:DNA-binding CsgD family transcriptional regulator
MSDLIGREGEVAALAAAVARARDGRWTAAAVVGEPGIGKSRLLDAAADLARREGLRVLRGRASEYERDLPLAAVVDALDHAVAQLLDDPAAEVDADAAGHLRAAFPAAGGGVAAGAPTGAAAAERHRLHRAIRSALEALAGAGRPVALLLDDLHWADEATVELVAALLRRPPDAPVLLLLAYRPGQVSAALRTAVDLAHADGLVRVTPERLDPAQAAEVLAGAGDLDVEAIVEASGGNPFALLQLTAHARTTGGALRAGDVPRTVLAAIGQEVAALPASAQQLLQGAAVVGDPFDLDLATASADLAPGDAVAALDVLVERELVRPADGPRRMAFRHPLVRHAVYEGTGLGWRLAAHRRAWRHLEGVGASMALRAVHVERAGEVGEEAAVTTLLAAIDEVVARAPDAAARWAASALLLLPADDPRRADVLRVRGRALAWAGQLEASRDAHHAALQLLPAGRPGWAAAVVEAATAEYQLRRHAESRELLQDALGRLPADAHRDRAALLLALADTSATGHHEESRRWAAEAARHAEALGDEALAAAALALDGLSGWRAGEGAPAAAVLTEAGARFDALPDDVAATAIRGLLWLSAGEFFADLPGAIDHAVRGRRLARATGQQHLLPHFVTPLCYGLQRAGRFPEAVEVADDGIEAAALAGHREWLGWALNMRAMTAYNALDPEAGLASAARAVEVAGRWRDEQRLIARMAYGGLLVMAGRADEAVDLMVEAGGGSELPDCLPWVRSSYSLYLVDAVLAVGDLDAAARWADLAARWAGPVVGAGAAATAAARLLLARGDAHAAAARASEGVDGWAREGHPVKAEHSRITLGDALAAAGDAAGAAGAYEAARSAFERFGSPVAVDLLARRLRGLGHRVPRRGGRGPAGQPLSERELQIARLVAAGLTNAAIGGRLHLSAKTVEAHLTKVFAKLDVRSRAAVGARLAEVGLTPAGRAPAAGGQAAGLRAAAEQSSGPSPTR